jgi:8-oxo-dGTP diphosphatase
MGQNDQGVKAGRNRYHAIPRVLVFLRHEEDVLLLKGSPSKKIWANLFNGVGGHVEFNEDIYSAARREVLEETGLQVTDLRLRAVVNIDAGDPNLGIIMFGFTGWCDDRRTIASHEGELHWIAADTIGQYDLVEDLDWLLPRILEMPAEASPMFLHYSYTTEDELLIRPANR